MPVPFVVAQHMPPRFTEASTRFSCASESQYRWMPEGSAIALGSGDDARGFRLGIANNSGATQTQNRKRHRVRARGGGSLNAVPHASLRSLCHR